MGGKRYDKNQYYDTMNEAVNVFGYKNVRSALIVGLDKSSDLVNEVKVMAQNGILPCLSVYRNLPNTAMHVKIPPTNSYLRKIYEECNNVVKNHGYKVQELGPLCNRCRNNMLII